jgi:hypothetical protein
MTNALWTEEMNHFLAETIKAVIVTKKHFAVTSVL